MTDRDFVGPPLASPGGQPVREYRVARPDLGVTRSESARAYASASESHPLKHGQCGGLTNRANVLAPVRVAHEGVYFVAAAVGWVVIGSVIWVWFVNRTGNTHQYE